MICFYQLVTGIYSIKEDIDGIINIKRILVIGVWNDINNGFHGITRILLSMRIIHTKCNPVESVFYLESVVLL